MIELLVAISIIALLLAILLPTVQRVRAQAKAVVCRSNLRQWGAYFFLYAENNNGRFFATPAFGGPTLWLEPMQPYFGDDPEILLCPMATQYKQQPGVSPAWGGSKSSAWDAHPDCGSYGVNYWIVDLSVIKGTGFFGARQDYWQTYLAEGAAEAPVLLDCMFGGGTPVEEDGPSRYEDVHPSPVDGGCSLSHFCTNRHSGYVNALFLDWSVRKVGLKELWTLKWHRQYNTRGPWTKAGGVRPEDWPAWMRRFKDY